MNEPTRKYVRQLRDQVSHAEYRVDSRAVADAIVRRRWAVALGARRAPTCDSVIAASKLDSRIRALAA